MPEITNNQPINPIGPNAPGQQQADVQPPLNDEDQKQLQEEVRKLKQELNDRTKNVSDRVRGAETNIKNTNKELDDCGVWAKVSGMTSALKKQLETDTKYKDQLAEQKSSLEQTRMKADRAIALGNYGLAKAILEGKEKDYKQSMSKIAKETMKGLQESNQKLQDADKFLSRTETTLKTVRTTAIVVGAVVATGGAAGAIAAAGYGTAAVAAGGFAAGTAAGTTMGAASNTVEATGHVAYGNKTVEQAKKDAIKQTLQDAKSSAIASGATVASLGVAASIAGTGASTGMQILASSAAGVTNSTITTTINVAEARIHAEVEFSKLYKEQIKNMPQDKVEKLKQQFLEQRGLTGTQILRNGAIDIGLGAVAGGQGGVGAQLRKAAGDSAKKNIALTVLEAGTGSATSLGTTYLKDGKLTVDGVLQNATSTVVGTAIGRMASNNNKATSGSKQKEPADNPSVNKRNERLIQLEEKAQNKLEELRRTQPNNKKEIEKVEGLLSRIQERLHGQKGETLYHEGYKVYGRDKKIDNSIHLGGGNREAIVVDFSRDVTLRKFYDKVKQKIGDIKDEKKILEIVHREIKKALPHQDDAMIDSFIKRRRVEKDGAIQVGEFIKEGVGVCRTDGVLAGAVLERLADQGILTGRVSVDRNQTFAGAHAWARYESKNGEVTIIDVRQQDRPIPKDSSKAAWLYDRPEEADNNLAQWDRTQRAEARVLENLLNGKKLPAPRQNIQPAPAPKIAKTASDVESALSGKKFGEVITIGRNPNSGVALDLHHGDISVTQARITKTMKGGRTFYRVEDGAADKASRNGTYYEFKNPNGKTVWLKIPHKTNVEVPDGTRIRFGSSEDAMTIQLPW